MNHETPRKFDRNLIVIGGGSAGLVTAYIAAAVKAKVTLIGSFLLVGLFPLLARKVVEKINAKRRAGVREA